MSNTPLHIPALIERGKWNDYRDEIWGDSYNWSWNRQPSEVEWLVIHHTVTKHDATPDDIALLHKARGWGGIGYHFVIDKEGVVYYVGDVGTARANVLNKNEKVIGISLIGDFTKHNPSDEQILSAHDLCQFFLDNTAVWPQLKTYEGSVVGHKELQATACPGTYWKGVEDSVFNRIKGRIPYTPQDPEEPEPEPEPQPDPCTTLLEAQKAEYENKIIDIRKANDQILADTVATMKQEFATELANERKKWEDSLTENEVPQSILDAAARDYTLYTPFSLLLYAILGSKPERKA